MRIASLIVVLLGACSDAHALPCDGVRVHGVSAWTTSDGAPCADIASVYTDTNLDIAPALVVDATTCTAAASSQTDKGALAAACDVDHAGGADCMVTLQLTDPATTCHLQLSISGSNKP